MPEEIKITKKRPRRGDDGHKIVSVRMKDETIERLDALAELINMLLDSALDIVKVEE